MVKKIQIGVIVVLAIIATSAISYGILQLGFYVATEVLEYNSNTPPD